MAEEQTKMCALAGRGLELLKGAVDQDEADIRDMLEQSQANQQGDERRAEQLTQEVEQLRDKLVNFRAYLAVQRERIAPALQGDLRTFAKTLYSAFHDQAERYAAQKPATWHRMIPRPPETLYHGTKTDNEIVPGTGKTLHSQGIWLTSNPKHAKEYADFRPEKGPSRVVAIQHGIQAPAYLSARDAKYTTADELKAKGHDSAYIADAGYWVLLGGPVAQSTLSPEQYSAESTVDQTPDVATLEQGGPTMPRKPKLQPFMVYRDDKPQGVSVRARDHEHAKVVARRWLGEGNLTARPITPSQAR